MAEAATRTAVPAPAAPARSARGTGRRTAAPRAASGGGPAAAGPAVKLSNEAAKDPRFKKALDKLQERAAKTRKHDPAAKKAAEAQAAAQPPANEKLAGAKANQVDTMQGAETKKPDNNSFLTMLRAEIQKATPKKTEDGEDFMKGDDRQQLKGAMTGNVNKQKEEAAKGIKSASEAPPDQSKVQGKEVTPLPAEPAPEQPAAISAAEAMPTPKPANDLSLEKQKGKPDTDAEMEQAEITPTQMQKANDPRFTKVLTTKGEADKQTKEGPVKYRATEGKVLTEAGTKAVGDEKQGLTAFKNVKGAAGNKVKSRQQLAKEKEEQERKAVTDHIEGIYTQTKEAVDKKLENIETEVTNLFDQGADAAIAAMKDYVEKRFDDRYSGISGKALWLKDAMLPLPDEVKAWFDQAYVKFQQDLDTLVVRVAALVETRLAEAKAMISAGQKEISEYVKGLSPALQEVGKAAEKEMASRFDELRQGVDEKKNDLAQKLAQRYKEAQDKGAAALKEMKDAHKSLLERIIDAIAEIVEILKKFRDRVMGMLKKGKQTLDLIVADPIGFLKNLLEAIKQGIFGFKERILEHLQEGFFQWLFGSLADTGITIPKDFSLPSILQLVLQVLGLTYARLQAKAVKLIGERNGMLIEKALELLQALWNGGPAALWEKLKEFLSDLKELVMSAVQTWLVETVVKGAIIKLATMFNPVGAIIQAIITIYNTVMFFIERINQILDFVEAVISSVHKIATGDLGSAASWIEKALARTIPIIIGFLARLLNISGIADKIVGFIKKIQDKVDKAVDKVIEKIVGGIKKLVGKGKEAVAAVFDWWKMKKQFKQGKESHSLYFEGSEDAAEIIIASKPLKLQDYIASLPEAIKTDPKVVKLINSIKAHIGIINSIKKRTKRNFGPTDGQTIQNSFEAIAQNLAQISSDEELPPTKVKWTTKKVGNFSVPDTMVANPLSLNPGGLTGSKPSVDTPIWNEVNKRGGKYVQGHLLNHHLHGPGDDVHNLVPITRQTNTRMEKWAEGKLKTAVLKEKKVIKYTVTVIYGTHSPRKYLKAEENLPKGITISALLLKKQDGQWKETSEVFDAFSLVHELPPDEKI